MEIIKKITALVAVCVLMAAICAPIVIAKDVDAHATVVGKSPVVKAITFSGDGVTGTVVSLTPGPGATTTTPVTITAVIYCKNGPDAIKGVTAEISPLINGYNKPIKMDEVSASTRPNSGEYETTIEIPSNTAPDDYNVMVTATHRNPSVTPGIGSENLTILGTIAINDLKSVNFGDELEPGGDPVEEKVFVSNWGNVNITIGVKPSDLESPDDVIPAKCITTTWNPSDVINVDKDAEIPVTLKVPEGTNDGVYQGTITFTPEEA